MLSADDIGVVLAAIDDSSPDVRRYVERLLVLLLPLVDDDRLRARFSELLKKEPVDEELQRSPDRLRIEQEPTIPAPGGFGHPEDERDKARTQLVLEFGRATELRSRFWTALQLMELGSCEYFDRVLDEIEAGPLDLAWLEWPWYKCRDMPPSECTQRMVRIASDTARRQDVRYIAWLIGREKGDETPPDLPDLRLLAEEELNWCLDRRPVIVPRYTGLFHYFLDPERVTILVNALFKSLLDLDHVFEDQWYMEGNQRVTFVAWCGRSFIPDIPALFDLYLRAFQTCREARDEWYELRDDNIVYQCRAGFLALGWQIAWVVSRASLLDMISALGPFVESPNRDERLAALALLEDAIRYSQKSAPLFGGVSAPELNDQALIEQIRLEIREAAAQEGYRRVWVFYGTNRKPTGSEKPSQWYGFEDGPLHLGVCQVTIPLTHELAKLESPAWHTVTHRLDPKRYVLLREIRPLAQAEFCGALRSTVNASQSRHALVFVHGYRVSFEDAARRTAQLACDLGIEIPLFFSWPTRVKLLGYEADATMALRAKPELLYFLDLIAKHSGAEIVHLIAHSMGALALSEAIVDYLATRSGRKKPAIREIILAAPDIDEKVFRNDIVPKIVNQGPHLTLYASRRDYALLCSRDLRFGLSRAGMVVHGKPVVVMDGVETIDVSAVNTELALGLLQGHSYVGDRSPVVQDIFELVKLGKRAKDRFGNVEASSSGVPYWIMQRRGN
jgi:esterase/lipase superfamily enzyme